MTSKPPTEPVVRALTDEDELDETELAAIVGGTGAAAALRGGADSWSRAVQDHALVISAGTPADRAAVPATPASATEQRALLPERATDAPRADKAAPVVGPDIDRDVSALFGTDDPVPPPKADDPSDQA